MTEQQIIEALARYESRLVTSLNNLEVARSQVAYDRENVSRMQTALRSVRARKGRKAHSR